MTIRTIEIFLVSILIITGLLIVILLANIPNSESNVIASESDLVSNSYGGSKLIISNPTTSLVQFPENFPENLNPTVFGLEEYYNYDDTENSRGGINRDSGNGDDDNGNGDDEDECKIDSDCKTDFFSNNFCFSGDVYKDFHDFSCKNKMCDENVKKELVKECEFGCLNGECIQRECNNDDDCNNDFFSDKYCSENKVVKDLHDFSCDTNSYTCQEIVTISTVEMCSDSCVNGMCVDVQCRKNSDCGEDKFIGDKFCKNGDVYQKFKSFMCVDQGTINSSCKDNLNDVLIEECSYDETCGNGKCTKVECNDDDDCNSDFFTNNYCSENNVVKDFHDFSCNAYKHKCEENISIIELKMCTDLCENGYCVDVQCRKDSDCGQNGFVGDEFCKNDDVYQDFKSFDCRYSGTSNSQCISDVESTLIEECQHGCNNGQCITEICDDGIDNDNDGEIDKLVELDPNNGEKLTIWDKDPWKIAGAVNQRINDFKLPYSLIANGAILRSDGDWTDDEDVPHTPTLKKICEILGYSSVKSHSCDSNFGSNCNYHTPSDNILWRYNGKDFEKETAEPKYGKSWIAGIICEHRLPECNDGVDNDNDGKIDYGNASQNNCDDGCASLDDDSEGKHDLDCDL